MTKRLTRAAARAKAWLSSRSISTGAATQASNAAALERRVRKAAASQTGRHARPTGQDQASRTPSAGRDALAAAEPDPGRGAMPDHGGHAGEQREQQPPLPGDQHRDRALAAVEQQGARGDVLAAGAQHVGRADVAGADGADVAQARPGG